MTVQKSQANSNENYETMTDRNRPREQKQLNEVSRSEQEHFEHIFLKLKDLQ